MPLSMALRMSGDALFGVGLLADVVAAEADGGDALAGGAEVAIDHAGGFGAGGGGFRGRLRDRCAGGCGDSGGGGGFEEAAAFHKASTSLFEGLDASWEGGDGLVERSARTLRRR